jgi:hypothetical protein
VPRDLRLDVRWQLYISLHDPSVGFCSKEVIYRSKNQTNDLTLDQWVNKLAEWQMSLIPIRAHIPTYSGHNFVSSSSQSYDMAFAKSAQLNLYWLRFQPTPSWEVSG